MTDDPHSHRQAGDGELLAAYLADELDDLEVRRLERRLLDDPQLRRRLDAVHDAVLAVRAPDDVDLPDGLAARLDDRLRAEAVGASGPAVAAAPTRAPAGRPSAGGVVTPWWRRPVAAVAAVSLLGVVAVSSVVIGTLGGGGDDTTVTAMSAQDEGAEEAAVGPESGAGAAAAQASPEAAAEADTGAAGADDAADTDTGAAAEAPAVGPLIEASPAGLVDAPALDDVGQRRDYLAGLVDAPARAALRAATAEETAAVASQQRSTLEREAGLDEACVDRLVSPDGPAALRLLRAQIDDREAVGAVLPTAGGGLRLQLVTTAGGCELLADEVLAPDEVGG